MKLHDLTLATPAENLACDEALLNQSEAGDGGEILRFWEPREYFVVVGYANKVEREVNAAACQARGVPIFRRCSGGGTVLQGPGCLNYALILLIAERPSLAGISGVNKFIMERNARGHRSGSEVVGSRRPALRFVGIPIWPWPPVLRRPGRSGAKAVFPVALRKFSGNSQRRS